MPFPIFFLFLAAHEFHAAYTCLYDVGVEFQNNSQTNKLPVTETVRRRRKRIVYDLAEFQDNVNTVVTRAVAHNNNRSDIRTYIPDSLVL